MSVEILELFDSGRASDGASSNDEIRYMVTGTDDETEVLAAVKGTAPTTLYGLKRVNVDVVPLGAGAWECTVAYEGLPNNSEYTFETGGGSVHITQSLANVARYAAAGQTAPDFGGAIGVNGDSIDGTDITVPVYNFTERHQLASSVVTAAYKLALFHATGKVNNATFKGLAAGEVLFLGASGAKTGIDNWEITYRFAASPNVSNLNVGGITVTSKKGWEYLWVRFRDAEDGTAKALVKRPVAAYVERVYESADFSTIGIGVT